MTRLLFATLLCALGTTQASAQTVVSQGLLELDDDERNASFTLLLRDSDRRCDQVIRTLFTGTVLGVRKTTTSTPNIISDRCRRRERNSAGVGIRYEYTGDECNVPNWT